MAKTPRGGKDASSEPDAPKQTAPKKRGPVVFITLDEQTDAELVAFIEAQRVPPDRATVGLMALREFLEREGFRRKPGK